MKFEPLHGDPEIGLIHDLISPTQAENLSQNAKGYLKTTPYTFLGKVREMVERFLDISLF